MNLRQVEIFRAVMLNGTTQRAAEVLHISQPGVSKALQDLERELGFELFHRTRKRLIPTAEAQLYIREVEDSFASLSRLRSAAARIRDFGSGQIKLATLSALSTNIVPRALVRFRSRYPEVSITLQSNMSSTVKDLVQSARFDLGLAANEIDVTGVEAREFAAFPAALAMPEHHPLTAKQVIVPEDLHDLPFIALSPEDTTRGHLDALLRERGVRPRVVLETPFANTICAMVQAGLGCGIVNPLSAELFVHHGLVLRPFMPVLLFRTLLIRPSDAVPSRIVETCIDALEQEAALAASRMRL
ncbi:LysR family transcriptional regulator [Hoeflea sp. BAL378]|nr:LysR family transcriptional regulator [Hoeflea sp. BAL378]